MYFWIVALLLGLLPAGSIAWEHMASPEHQPLLLLLGKWFVFWAVGVRLFVAGLRQSIQPRFTAETIFELKEDASLAVVQELGFANLAFGTLGIASIILHAWTVPAAVAGGMFYGLAGMKHVMNPGRNRLRQVAMLSDLFAFVVLATYVIGMAITSRT